MKLMKIILIIMIILMMIFLIIMIQEPGANYRVSTNTKQHKYEDKNKQYKLNQLTLSQFNHRLLTIIVMVIICI
jgi:ABC-type dipeptide/oligopeptide/nickel transport system permease component